ncbi:hypothetical protein PUNSTDRAFT_98263 [Punctularia strigosozonata HHB-11173 SS5]|uniref:uncharacterized protein n=1 Tax=Punctularia strigosozonata (strain HHB-11173) TaxID=741275 RepID=UPI00044170D1|nr:uncharacterized protein PUNSTDRAFT_98263 [Punctularia strigosozonata HHB-11173 SS5]EIN11198.1 hypothetical protein PUNSTDRAFT_98263 [Punctularia strigosozonata HHB-11173 SS5]
MKVSTLIGFVALAQAASAHYIFTTLIAGSTTSEAAVREPVNNSPITSATDPNLVCNIHTAATSTVSVPAGSTIGFKLDNTLYHLGPAAIYLGQVPSGETAATWDGTGAHWFKIAEWGATYSQSFSFSDYNLSQLTTTIPSDVPPGDYLVHVEQIALHVVDAPQWYVSCAQITITGGGSANPSKVSIPGAYSANDPGLTVDIYTNPTSYTVPGPAPFTG